VALHSCNFVRCSSAEYAACLTPQSFATAVKSQRPGGGGGTLLRACADFLAANTTESGRLLCSSGVTVSSRSVALLHRHVENAQLLPSLAARVRARNALPLDALLEVTATSKRCSQTLISPSFSTAHKHFELYIVSRYCAWSTRRHLVLPNTFPRLLPTTPRTLRTPLQSPSR